MLQARLSLRALVARSFAASADPSKFTSFAVAAAASKVSGKWDVARARAEVAAAGKDVDRVRAVFKQAYLDMRSRPDLKVMETIFNHLTTLQLNPTQETEDFSTMLKSYSKNSDTVGAKNLWERVELNSISLENEGIHIWLLLTAWFVSVAFFIFIYFFFF